MSPRCHVRPPSGVPVWFRQWRDQWRGGRVGGRVRYPGGRYRFRSGLVLLGCAAGAFLAGGLADFMGRRPTMLFNAVLFLLSAVGAGAAESADIFIAARILGGLAIGAASVL